VVRPELRARVVATWPLVAAGALLVAHACRFGFVTDDAYISFVYARNLAEHGELAFNVGLPPVEGYTNFLWTILLALAYRVGLPIEGAALALGVGFALATMAVVWRLGRELLDEPDGPWPAVAPALLAATSGYACWASGGLETQLFTFLVVLALALAATAATAPRRLRHVGWVLALAAMTRPEGLLVAGVVALHRVGGNLLGERRLRPTRDELAAVGGFVALWAPWFAWRWWYYGWPLPNTAYVKAAGPASPGYDATMRALGWHYVATWAKQTGLVVAFPLALLGLGAAGRGTPRRRFVMPLLPIAALGVALGAAWLVGRVPPGRGRRAAAAAAIAALVGGHAVRQLRLTRASMRPGNYASDRGIDTPAFLAVYAHDRAAIGRAMRPCFRPDDFAIYGGAGAKPFFAGVRGIDVFGLVSERIAHEVPRTRPRPGHNKWAPDALLLEHAPTFVFSCYDLHRDPARPRLPCDVGGWRRRGFVPVTMHIPGLVERGEYYTFLARADRAFRCPGVVP
jgi:hypothetical protein